MDPLGSLREEHSSALRELYTLDRQLGWLESSAPPVTRRALVQLLSTSQKLASDLSSHFQKEEKTLFSWEKMEVLFGNAMTGGKVTS